MKWPESIPVPDNKPDLQLSGEDGNAFFIIARARSAAKKAGWSREQIEAFSELAESDDYDNVLRTCMDYFEVA